LMELLYNKGPYVGDWSHRKDGDYCSVECRQMFDRLATETESSELQSLLKMTTMTTNPGGLKVALEGFRPQLIGNSIEEHPVLNHPYWTEGTDMSLAEFWTDICEKYSGHKCLAAPTTLCHSLESEPYTPFQIAEDLSSEILTAATLPCSLLYGTWLPKARSVDEILSYTDKDFASKREVHISQGDKTLAAESCSVKIVMNSDHGKMYNGKWRSNSTEVECEKFVNQNKRFGFNCHQLSYEYKSGMLFTTMIPRKALLLFSGKTTVDFDLRLEDWEVMEDVRLTGKTVVGQGSFAADFYNGV